MAITSWSGHGGTVTKTAPGGSVTFDGVTEWKLTKTAVLAETTHAGTLGWQQRKRVVKGGSFSLNFIWDSTNAPDNAASLQMDEGDEVTLKLKLGGSARFYTVPAIVETLEITDDQTKDVVRGTLSGFINAAVTLT